MSKGKKLLIRTFVTIFGALVAVTPIVSEYHQFKTKDKIESAADLNVPRSFDNIKSEKMGTFLTDTIDYLYEKYPDLDNLIYSGDGSLKNPEALSDIYKLYKAEMVDNAIFKKADNLADVKVTIADQIIVSHDKITENGETITKTYKEQDKGITNEFVRQKENQEYDATKLAKLLYEYLQEKYGLEENCLTSEEIQLQLDKNGFYYDVATNTFYTPEGIADLVLRPREKETSIDETQLAINDDGFER